MTRSWWWWRSLGDIYVVLLTPADLRSQNAERGMKKKHWDSLGCFYLSSPLSEAASLNKRRSSSCSWLTVCVLKCVNVCKCELQLCSSVFICLSLIFTASAGSMGLDTPTIISFLVSKRRSRNLAKLFSSRFWLTRRKGEERRGGTRGERRGGRRGEGKDWVKEERMKRKTDGSQHHRVSDTSGLHEAEHCDTSTHVKMNEWNGLISVEWFTDLVI